MLKLEFNQFVHKCFKGRYIVVLLALTIIAGIAVCLQGSFLGTKKMKKPNVEQQLIAKLNITLDRKEPPWLPDGGGDNITGWPQDIVPNVVHNILFQHHAITYVHMLSLLSVIKIQKPEKIIIHCDCDRLNADDENWMRIIGEVNKTNEISVHIETIERPTEIFGKKLRFLNHHASDVTRWRIMNEHGGIYIDNDVFICQPLNQFFKYEFTLGWEERDFLGSQVLIGNRNARFPKFVMQTYRAYNGLW